MCSSHIHPSVHVPSSDPHNAFQRSMVNGILVRAGENCTIPCLVTDPEVRNMALETCDKQPLPSGLSYRSNLQQGIIISNARKEYEGCYVCVGQLDRLTFRSIQYTVDVRLGECRKSHVFPVGNTVKCQYSVWHSFSRGESRHRNIKKPIIFIQNNLISNY